MAAAIKMMEEKISSSTDSECQPACLLIRCACLENLTAASSPKTADSMTCMENLSASSLQGLWQDFRFLLRPPYCFPPHHRTHPHPPPLHLQ